MKTIFLSIVAAVVLFLVVFMLGKASARLEGVNYAKLVDAQWRNYIAELSYKQKVISELLTREECETVFMQHYRDYATYWTGTESIVLNAEEETAHFCDYLLNEYKVN